MRKIKILYIDLLCFYGHTDINNLFIKFFKETKDIEQIDLVGKKNYFENNKLELSDNLFEYNNKWEFRLKNIKKIRVILKNIDLSKYDLVFISSYETISFSIAWKSNVRTLVFNHNNVDELKNSFIKRFFFKMINKKVEHIVYEEFIKDYIKELKVNNKVWVNHHPIDFSKRKIRGDMEDQKNNKLLVYAPSGSNSDKFIKQIIEYRKRKDILNNNIKLVIKSNNIKFKDEQLFISDERVSYKKYVSNFKKAKLVALLFNKNFEYRVSGVFFDALAFKKNLIIKENKFSNYYLNKYPKLGISFNNPKEFLEMVNNLVEENNKYKKNEDFDKIYRDYSKEQIKNEIKSILSSSIKNN